MARHDQTLTGLGQALTSSKARQQVSSIVGITADAHEAVAAGAGYALVFLGFISLVLAVINLFPFLPLDGGHILWALAEKVRGRRISLMAMYRFSSVGIVLLVFLVINGVSNDIGRLSGLRRPPQPRAARQRTHTQLLTSGPKRSGARRTEQRFQLAAPQQLDVLPPARPRPDASSAGAARAGSQCATGSSECGSIGKEHAGVCTNQPRPTRRSSAANAARRAGGTCSITLEQYTRSNSPSANGSPSAASARTNGPG